MLFLVDENLGVYVIWNSVWDRTTIGTLQPFITVILLSDFVVFALKRRGAVDSLDAARVALAPTQKISMFATALE
jgi:hypothetical protein